MRLVIVNICSKNVCSTYKSVNTKTRDISLYFKLGVPQEVAVQPLYGVSRNMACHPRVFWNYSIQKQCNIFIIVPKCGYIGIYIICFRVPLLTLACKRQHLYSPAVDLRCNKWWVCNDKYITFHMAYDFIYQLMNMKC